MRSREETLDPRDWNKFRGLAHQMLDDILTYQQTVRRRPVWRPVPKRVERKFEARLPLKGQSESEVYREFKRFILPYPLGNIHPRFWGWVMGNGTPLGSLSEMLAAGMNPNLGGGNHVANLVERQVIDWLREMLGYSEKASGLLVSGGSMANLTGLAVARNSKAGYDVREKGLSGRRRRMVLYGSAEMHSSLTRAVELLGLGRDALRCIPVDDAYRVDVDKLRTSVESDLKSGKKPICVIGTAGSTNTGSIDPLKELADVASEYNLWFHVDGAFGAFAYLPRKLRHLVKGMECADSIAFDLHKWGYLPFEVGCILVRDAEAHRSAFAMDARYLKHGTRGTAGDPVWFSDYGVQLTRGFRALKVWMALKAYGVRKLSALVQQNVEQASYLAELIRKSDDLELMAPVALNVVCFRFMKSGFDNAQLNSLNEELLVSLQESGIAVLSGTDLQGRYAMRCAITNHRSIRNDFDLLVSEIEREGNLLQEKRAIVSAGSKV